MGQGRKTVREAI